MTTSLKRSALNFDYTSQQVFWENFRGNPSCHHFRRKNNAIVEEKLLITEKVTTSEDFEKANKNLDDMKEAVFTIRRKDLDNFEGQSKGSIGWFNFDHDFLKRIFLHLNRTYIYFL